MANISSHGFWVFVANAEYFLPFSKFPWFRDVPVGQILHVKLLRRDHLYWPDIDVDLTLDSIIDPEKYPLVSRERPAKKYRPKGKTTRRG